VIFFLVSYQPLEKSYHWLEQQFINNIKIRTRSTRVRYEELAPWDTHLVEIEVGEKSPLVGKTLGEGHIRERFGVNIVAISHGSRVLPAPRGKEKIIARDKLIVLGNDKQIDAFQQHVKSITDNEVVEATSFLSNFILRAILLEDTHPLIGKTIRDSNIRENFNGIVVGIERHNRRILNPDPDIVLQDGDLLLIVGEVEAMEQMDGRYLKSRS
jgi:CPA2 family monovalent cation:H+ antiporter-2